MKHTEKTFDILQSIRMENDRFKKRLDAAINRLAKDSNAHYRCKEVAALKRASLDLKNELTRLTEGIRYEN